MAEKTNETVTSKKVSKIACPNCGTKNSIKSKFCSSCGATLQPIEEVKKEEVRNPQKQKETKKAEETLIFGHFKPKFFLILGILTIILIGLFIFFSSSFTKTKAATLSCTVDSCQAGYYCSSYGACIKAYCGDGICTTQERANNSCPIDCGCGSGYILNKYTNQCQKPINVSTQIITGYIDKYLNQNNVTGSITAINNTYYGNSTVKEVIVNCQLNQTSYPCQIIFYFNQNGTAINVIRTT
jgi:hypothetical protein